METTITPNSANLFFSLVVVALFWWFNHGYSDVVVVVVVVVVDVVTIWQLYSKQMGKWDANYNGSRSQWFVLNG